MAKINFIKIAKKSASIQIRELKKINKTFNQNFVKSVEAIHKTKGKVVCSGVGKSGLIARKVSASLSSVGISSFFLDPNSAIHGDLGQIDKRDILIVFSYSGNTSELTSLLKYSNRFGIKVIGIASEKDSILIKASDIPLMLPKVKEADPIGMVPSSSTSITLLLGDCLMSALLTKQKFTKERFKVYHPGGNLGRALLLVKDVMLTGNKIPIINFSNNIVSAVKIISKKNLGIGIVVKNKKVIGIVTDGDIRRGARNYSKKTKITTLMSKKPFYIGESVSAAKALSIMNDKKITSLIVSSDLDYEKKRAMFKPKGILHIHSLLKYGMR